MIRKLIAALMLTALFTPTVATAASPSPKPTAHSTAKSSAKSTAKAAPKSTASTKTTKSATTKHTVVHHYYPRKKVIVSPSPKPVWPPKGYAANNGVYAFIPSGTQLVSLLSSQSTLNSQVSQCKSMACGAVYVGSDSDCQYWEINSKVYGPNPADVTSMIEYGTLRTLAPATKAQKILPVILLSGEPLFPHETLILQTLGTTSNNFYTQIAEGKSLTQIAGNKINSIVSAITSDESKSINSQFASGAISSDQAQALRDATSVRIATELTNYNLNVGGITVSCWTQPATDKVPSFTYTMNSNHF